MQKIFISVFIILFCILSNFSQLKLTFVRLSWGKSRTNLQLTGKISFKCVLEYDRLSQKVRLDYNRAAY